MPTQYVNKATLNGTTTVYWTTTGASDPTGAQSGYNPATLTNIGVDYTTQVSSTSTGGQTLDNGGWTTALDLNFAQQPSQTLSSNTTYTIAGKTWTKYNSANDATAMAITNGTGLVVTPNNSTTDYNMTGGGGRSAPLLGLPLSSIIPNFNTRTRLRIWVYISSENNNAQYDNALFGVDVGAGSVSYVGQRGNGTTGNPGFNGQMYFNASAGGFFGRGQTLSSANNVVMMEIPVLGDPNMQISAGSFGTSWPDISQMVDMTAYQHSGTINASTLTSSNAALFLGAMRYVSGTSGFAVTFARVKVEYLSTVQQTLGTITLADGYSNIPTAGISGRLFLPTDGYNSTIYRDNGASWVPFDLDAAPNYADLDSNTVLCWRFQESSAPFPNLGTQASEDMTAESGEGTVWAGGQPDNAFGKALKFSMVSTGSGGIRANNFTWPTSVITSSIWFTPTRSVGAVSIGRVFFKAYYPSSWSSPYIGIEMGYFASTSGFSVTANATGGAAVATANQDYNGVPLWQRHHIGMTYGDGYLRLYVDGFLVKTTVSSNVLDLGTGPWCIGRTVNTSSNEHCGMILHEARVDKVIRDATWFYNTWKKGRVR